MKFEQLLFEGKAGEEIDHKLIDLVWDHMKKDKIHRDRVMTSWGSKTKAGLTASVRRIFTDPKFEGHTKFELMELIWDFVRKDKMHRDRAKTSFGSKTKTGLYDAISKIYEGTDSEDSGVEDLEEAKNRPDFDHVLVYDAGNEVADRYTVVYKPKNGDKHFFGMSDNPSSPNGFNQYVGDSSDGYKEGRHLGRLLDGIPEQIKSAVADRIADYRVKNIEENIDEEILIAKHNNPDYKFYIVIDGKIHSGWSYIEDAKDELQPDQMSEKLLAKKPKIWTLSFIKQKGLDPDKNENWMTTSDVKQD